MLLRSLSTDIHYEDKELWDMFRGGDRVAYQQFYLKYLDELFAYGIKVMKDHELVKDTLQDYFIELWENRTKLQEVSKVRFYVYKSFRRKLIRSKLKRDAEQLKDEQLSDTATQEQAFESSLIKYEEEQALQQRLQMAFKTLPAKQKEVIDLLFHKEFSYEEISGILSINLRSVYTLAWKAISSLKKRLHD